MNPAPGGQKRLDEVLGLDHEAQEERAYRELRETRSSHASIPYEERVAAWIAEREAAMRKRGTVPPSSEPTPEPPAPATGPAKA